MIYHISFRVPHTDVVIEASINLKYGASISPPRGLVIGTQCFAISHISTRETQLVWKGLFTKSGLPLRDPVRLLKSIKILEADGWLVHKQAFTNWSSNRFFQKLPEVIPNGD